MLHRRDDSRPRGFTLIELLIAVSLLVLIILVTSYIFDSTMKAVSQTQANTELNLSLEAYSQVMRGDLRAMEHRGMLLFGARQQGAYGNVDEQAAENKRGYRTDWLMMFIGSEQYSVADPRLIGQWSRIFYGHGRVTDRTQSTYSPLATDWVLIRGQTIECVLAPPMGDVQVLAPDWGASAWSMGIEYPQHIGSSQYLWYCLDFYSQSYTSRRFALINEDYRKRTVQFQGTPYYSLSRLPGGETTFYHYWDPTLRDPELPTSVAAGLGSVTGKSAFWGHLLPHCASFKIQYALPEDLTAGAGGSPVWRDPPFVGQIYKDSNYKARVWPDYVGSPGTELEFAL